MIKIQKLTGLVVIMLLSISLPSWGAEAAKDQSLAEQDLALLDKTEVVSTAPTSLSIMERIKSIPGVDPKQWGIRKGCINSSRIRKIRFLDDQTAMLSLRGKKKALMRLETACPGIKRNGFARIKDSVRLCKKFDSFSVLGGNYSCRVAAIDPYVALVDPPAVAKLD